MDDRSPIERAIAEAGSEQKLADAIKYSQVAVNKAKHAGRVSAEMAVAIERATSVKTWELRPDLWPAPAPEPERVAS